MGSWLAGGARGERDLRMVEAVARISLGGGRDRGGWLLVLSEQMERRDSAEAVAVLKGVRGGLARVLRSSVGYSAEDWGGGAVAQRW